MKAHCPACGRTTRVGEDALDFMVRCDRCRTMLLARSPKEGVEAEGAGGVGGVVAKAEVLPLGRIPERFGTPERGQIAYLLTRKARRGDGSLALAQHAARMAKRSPAFKVSERRGDVRGGYGFIGIIVFVAVAVVAIGLLIVGAKYWAFRPATADGSVVNHSPDAAETPVAVAPLAAKPRSSRTTPPRIVQPAPVSETPQPTGTGELFPDVPARK